MFDPATLPRIVTPAELEEDARRAHLARAWSDPLRGRVDTAPADAVASVHDPAAVRAYLGSRLPVMAQSMRRLVTGVMEAQSAGDEIDVQDRDAILAMVRSLPVMR